MYIKVFKSFQISFFDNTLTKTNKSTKNKSKQVCRLTWLCLSLEPQSADHFGDQAVSDKEKMLTDLRLRIERLLLFVRSPDILQS